MDLFQHLDSLDYLHRILRLHLWELQSLQYDYRHTNGEDVTLDVLPYMLAAPFADLRQLSLVTLHFLSAANLNLILQHYSNMTKLTIFGADYGWGFSPNYGWRLGPTFSQLQEGGLSTVRLPRLTTLILAETTARNINERLSLLSAPKLRHLVLQPSARRWNERVPLGTRLPPNTFSSVHILTLGGGFLSIDDIGTILKQTPNLRVLQCFDTLSDLRGENAPVRKVNESERLGILRTYGLDVTSLFNVLLTDSMYFLRFHTLPQRQPYPRSRGPCLSPCPISSSPTSEETEH